MSGNCPKRPGRPPPAYSKQAEIIDCIASYGPFLFGTLNLVIKKLAVICWRRITGKLFPYITRKMFKEDTPPSLNMNLQLIAIFVCEIFIEGFNYFSGAHCFPSRPSIIHFTNI